MICVLSRRFFSLSFRLVVFLSLWSYVLTSTGDMDPAFRSCSWRCYNEDDCENKMHLYQGNLKALLASTRATVPTSTTVGGNDYRSSGTYKIRQHLAEAYFYYTEPHCLEICSYKCAWNMTQERLSQGLPVLKYHGHWAFKRPLGYDMHEVSSSMFSVANAIPHLLQIAKQWSGSRYDDVACSDGAENVRLRASAGSGYWGDYFLAIWITPYPYVATVTWLSSAVYHARRTRASTTLDLCTALVLLAYGLLITVRRVFGPLAVFGKDFQQQVVCCNYGTRNFPRSDCGGKETATGTHDGDDVDMAGSQGHGEQQLVMSTYCAALLFNVVSWLPLKPAIEAISTSREFDVNTRKQMQWRYVFVQLRVVALNAMLLIGLPLLVWRLYAMSVSSTISFSEHMTLAIPLAAASSAIWTVWALMATDYALSAEQGRPVVALSQSSLLYFASFEHGGSYANRVRMLLFQCWFMLAALMEIFDFPPFFGLFDAHSLWHACTVPLGFFWYRFLQVDATTRRAARDELGKEGNGQSVDKGENEAKKGN